MSINLLEYKSTEFLAQLAAGTATPGGGGAAAYAGALGAALVSMVANLTLGRKKYAEVASVMQELLGEAEELRHELEGLVTADAVAFQGFMAAYKLPKETEAEQLVKAERIQVAARAAGEVPLQIARACVKVLALSYTVAQQGNTNAIGDAAVAALLARAAVRSAVYNVVANLMLVQDSAYVATTKEELDKLQAEAAKLEEQVLAATDQCLRV